MILVFLFLNFPFSNPSHFQVSLSIFSFPHPSHLSPQIILPILSPIPSAFFTNYASLVTSVSLFSTNLLLLTCLFFLSLFSPSAPFFPKTLYPVLLFLSPSAPLTLFPASQLAFIFPRLDYCKALPVCQHSWKLFISAPIHLGRQRARGSGGERVRERETERQREKERNVEDARRERERHREKAVLWNNYGFQSL